jgi:hypothetical protein
MCDETTNHMSNSTTLQITQKLFLNLTVVMRAGTGLDKHDMLLRREEG